MWTSSYILDIGRELKSDVGHCWWKKFPSVTKYLYFISERVIESLIALKLDLNYVKGVKGDFCQWSPWSGTEQSEVWKKQNIKIEEYLIFSLFSIYLFQLKFLFYETSSHFYPSFSSFSHCWVSLCFLIYLSFWILFLGNHFISVIYFFSPM